MHTHFHRLKPIIVAIVVGTLSLAAWAGDDADDMHAHHHHHADAAGSALKISKVEVDLKSLKLVGAGGKTVSLDAALADPRPVLLNFIFTTCTAICPVMSHTFAEVQEALGTKRGKLHMVSISIDPEHDTPARLTQYASSFQAGPQWQFFSGTAAASIAAQKAFDVFRGDKMNHEPTTFVRQAPGQPWVRLDGLATPEDLLRQFPALSTRQ